MEAAPGEEQAVLASPSHDHGDDLRWLFRQLPGAAWITDRDLRITQIIGEVERNLGRTNAQLFGLTVSEVAETREPADQATSAHVAALGGVSSSFRYRLLERWYEVHVEPLRDGDQIVGCIGAAVDITSRVELEQRVAADEARAAERQRRSISLLEATIESTADGILVVDRAGKVIAFNKRFLALWGIAVELASHGDDAELVAFVSNQLNQPEAFLARVREIYATPAAEDLDVLEFKDGRVFERYSRPQYVDGEIVGRVWSFRDVTERNRLLHHALALADVSRLLGSLDATAALESVARLLTQSLFIACVFELFSDGAEPRRIAVARDPTSGVLNDLPIAPGGTHAEMHELGDHVMIQVPLRAAGRLGGWLAVLGARPPCERDVQLLDEIARRCAVALENSRLYRAARDEILAREEFLAVASHELRGPIAAIRLAVEGLRSGVATGKFLDIVDREEHRLERLVDELLDLGRLQSGHLALVIEPADLDQIVRGVATRLEPERARSGSSLTIKGERPLEGHWDRMRLEQIVTNLVSNALKFGNGKPIDVLLARDGDRVILTVTDHGIGIPEHKLSSIFEPFERAVPARHYGGLGLGLYIVRALVTRMGGTITAHSVVDAGTTFIVELPREVNA